MEKLKKALDRIFIEGLSAMAQGLFATLIDLADDSHHRCHVLCQRAFYIRKAYGRAVRQCKGVASCGNQRAQGICGNLHHQFPAGGAGRRHAGIPVGKCGAARRGDVSDGLLCGGLHRDPGVGQE